ncbi:MAG: hypothetical protein WCP31_00500, partial [Chloroflexales bacterium]
MIVITLGASEEESGARLTAALAGASAGATLHLSAGVYRLAQPLLIDKPLTLTGEGMDRTRLLCAAEDCVARFTGDGSFIIADLSFEHTGSLGARVVKVNGGEVDIQRCRFTGGVWDEASQRGGSGLCIGGQTRGRVMQCEAAQNQLVGILVTDQAHPML